MLNTEIVDMVKIILFFYLVKDKSCTLENEERLEIYQKNFLQVRKDDLTRSIKFYKNQLKVTYIINYIIIN